MQSLRFPYIQNSVVVRVHDAHARDNAGRVYTSLTSSGYLYVIGTFICIEIEGERRVIPTQSHRFTLERILELRRAKGIGDVEVFLETWLAVSHHLGHLRHRCRRSGIGLIKPCHCLVQLTIGPRAD